MKKFKISVFGSSFVGLTTAVGLSIKGFHVRSIDKNQSLINSLKKGKVPFKEPFLEENLRYCLEKKRINFSSKFQPDNDLNVVFICVGTPLDKKGNYKLNFINQILSQLSSYKDKSFLVVIKSTVFPGSYKKFIKKFNVNKNLIFCSTPEFLREGNCWNDFIYPDRILIGIEDKKYLPIMKKIYKKFEGKKIFTNITTAEYIKILSNNILSNLISFSNSMSIAANKIGDIDIKKSFDIVKLDKRWFGSPAGMSGYLHPGLGYGGYCLPKDTRVLDNFFKKYYPKINPISFNLQVNQLLPKIFAQIVLKYSKNFKKIALLGISFKEGSDDLRFSKSIELFDILKKKTKKKIMLFDPLVKIVKKRYKVFQHLKYKKDTLYVLCNKEKNYIKLLSKFKKDNYLDLRYILK